jgi:hypothetical protein
METIKSTVTFLLVLSLLAILSSCTKDKAEMAPVPPVRYIDRVAQDLNYRLGKWYSISDGAGYGFTRSPLLDTICFISDSIAGWTGFGGQPYSYFKTYFKDPFHIVHLVPDPNIVGKIDTGINECGMTLTGDTFTIFWDDGYGTFPESYLKKK